MTENIGRKIKSFAFIMYWVEVVSSVLFSIIMIFNLPEDFYVQHLVLLILAIIISPFVLYIPFLIFYGLGIVVERAENEVWNKDNAKAAPDSQSNIRYERNSAKAYDTMKAERDLSFPKHVKGSEVQKNAEEERNLHIRNIINSEKLDPESPLCTEADSDGFIICPVCLTRQKSADTCKRCSQRLSVVPYKKQENNNFDKDIPIIVEYDENGYIKCPACQKTQIRRDTCISCNQKFIVI